MAGARQPAACGAAPRAVEVRRRWAGSFSYASPASFLGFVTVAATAAARGCDGGGGGARGTDLNWGELQVEDAFRLRWSPPWGPFAASHHGSARRPMGTVVELPWSPVNWFGVQVLGRRHSLPAMLVPWVSFFLLKVLL
ncbi:hypothetical protein C2845_PM07G15510 [Panicum miliaceum]|uniref:Uncharacterized protein n=1 Tax=Panicum miliaceum TaxID=4540 RepID=A0A3L6SJV9_PANMI|nr:hypothetical protein C2845_PM07G15510 [Panicum miliaceum]